MITKPAGILDRCTVANQLNYKRQMIRDLTLQSFHHRDVTTTYLFVDLMLRYQNALQIHIALLPLLPTRIELYFDEHDDILVYVLLEIPQFQLPFILAFAWCC
jgi:hypothetical protein